MTKITVIVRTIRNDYEEVDAVRKSSCQFKQWQQHPEWLNNPLIDSEFKDLYNNCIVDSRTMFEMMLESFVNQTFKDFEILFVHRHPEKVNQDVFREYKDKIDVKLIKSKHSIWNDLGEQYCDYVNITNTGIIWANADILHMINDCSLYPPNYLQEVYNLFKNNKLAIAPRISYSIVENFNGKFKVERGIWQEYNYPILKTYNYPSGDENKTDNCAWWGYSLTYSLDDILKINGHDESLDGWIGTDDGDLGRRMSLVTNKIPTMMENPAYTLRVRRNHLFDDKFISSIPYYAGGRNNKVMLQILNQRPLIKNYIVANNTRPTRRQMNIYKRWHLKNKDVLDENYDKCIDVPTYDLRELRKIRNTNPKKCGEVII